MGQMQAEGQEQQREQRRQQERHAQPRGATVDLCAGQLAGGAASLDHRRRTPGADQVFAAHLRNPRLMAFGVTSPVLHVCAKFPP